MTEGPRTPDLQGHNLGEATAVHRCWPPHAYVDQGGRGFLARVRPCWLALDREDVVARVLPGERASAARHWAICVGAIGICPLTASLHAACGCGQVPTAADGAMMVRPIVSEEVMLLIERRALVV